MMELIRSIIMLIMGVGVVVAELLTGDLDIGILVLGGLITFCGIIWTIMEIIKKNKK